MISLNPHNLPLIKNRNELEKMYETSQAHIREVIDKAHSKTLDKLYTDEFRPEVLKSNKTTVMSLKTGEAIPVDVECILTEGRANGSHRRRYTARTEDGGKELGFKTFGVKDKGDRIELTPGYIYSSKNDDYAGTQIRLLQIACEFAKKKGLDEIPLISLFPALKFHTMMGFRPVPEKSFKMMNKNDLNVASNMFAQMYSGNKFRPEDVVPIFSKIDGDIYFDRNMTAFHAVMKDNERTLANSNKRHLSLATGNLDSDITMRLDGKEFDKWQSRLKGFEILPDEEVEPRKATFFEKVKCAFGLFE